MKGFIEVHDVYNDGVNTLINIDHITTISGNCIYTDDIPPFATDYPCIKCEESYDEIKALIINATKAR